MSDQPDAASANKETDKPESAKNSLISDETPLLEWIVAAVGLVLVLSTIGFTFYRALRETATPPAVTVTVETIVAQDEGYLVTFRALNRGEGTAAVRHRRGGAVARWRRGRVEQRQPGFCSVALRTPGRSLFYARSASV